MADSAEESMSGKTVVITGCTHGLGLQSLEALTAKGARVLALCRNTTLAEEVVLDIKSRVPSADIVTYYCDLSNVDTIRACAEAINAAEQKVDVLINNAAMLKNSFELSEYGYEAQFQVNVLGPFLLTNLLLDKLKASAPSRIVIVSSLAYKYANARFNCEEKFVQEPKKYSPFSAYAYTKLANAYHGVELAKKLSGTEVDVHILHPGAVKTNLGSESITQANCCLRCIIAIFRRCCMLETTEGIRSIMRCACDPTLQGHSGAFYIENGSEKPFTATFRRNQGEMCTEVWNFCEKACEKKTKTKETDENTN